MKRILEIEKFQARSAQSHKGDYGRVLIVGGSSRYIGAPALAANGALRSGAGLVTMAVPRSIQSTVASLACCATSIALPDNEQGIISDEALPLLREEVFARQTYDVVAVGPGLGHCPAIVSFIVELNNKKIPCVIDADALNCLAELSWFGLLTGPCVITPHPGELGRLLRKTTAQIQSDREGSAISAAELMGKGQQADGSAVCLLKGNKTIVTNGESFYENQTGNPGMASGGSGDVLTGVIAAIMAQKAENFAPFMSAAIGANVHGLAGDLAAKKIGEISLMASDLLKFLPEAFLRNML